MKRGDQDNDWVMTFYGLKVVGMFRRMIGRIKKKMSFGMLWVFGVLRGRKGSFLQREYVNDFIGTRNDGYDDVGDHVFIKSDGWNNIGDGECCW